ncbi:MAG: GNAT family N-acetyltransferase [Flavobacteriales bacterium]|nr:GNAT family N-acetyltransferase [Flavobacteriales bacterium]
MPFLRLISTPFEREVYHRFRYAIYADSVQRGFLSGPEGFDTDEYDASALHLGWYEGEELVGCVRLLRPIPGPHPLHLFKDLDAGPLREDASGMLRTAEAEGITLHEVSRLCLAPSHRSLSTVRRFVLAIIAAAHRHGVDRTLFTCDAPHAAFWLRMGFTIADGFRGYHRPRTPLAGCLLHGSYHDLYRLHSAELQRVGLALLLPLSSAA